MSTPMTPRDRMMIGDQTAADRLLASQKLQAGSLYLHGDAPPTRNQISAVLHALGDHSLQAHMNSTTVLSLGDDRAHLGGTWRADTAHGRFFQMMGDWVADWSAPTDAASDATSDSPENRA